MRMKKDEFNILGITYPFPFSMSFTLPLAITRDLADNRQYGNTSTVKSEAGWMREESERERGC